MSLSPIEQMIDKACGYEPSTRPNPQPHGTEWTDEQEQWAAEEWPHWIGPVRIPENYPHRYAYSGASAGDDRCRTFSVGVFEILPRVGGKGRKRGPVLKRFRGPVSDAACVFDAAEAHIRHLESVLPFDENAPKRDKRATGRKEMAK